MKPRRLIEAEAEAAESAQLHRATLRRIIALEDRLAGGPRKAFVAASI